MTFDIAAQIKDRRTIFDEWGRLGLPNPPTHTGVVCSPFREDRTPSFSVFEQGRAWKDFGTDEGGDVISFRAKADGVDAGEAIRRMATEEGLGSAGGELVTVPILGVVKRSDKGVLVKTEQHGEEWIPAKLAQVNEARNTLTLPRWVALKTFPDKGRAAGSQDRQASSPPKPLAPAREELIQDYGIGTPEQWEALARARGLPWPLSIHGIRMAGDLGTVRFGKLKSHGKLFDCWFTTDTTSRCIIARRMDGKPLPTEQGEAKSKCVQGSHTAWPIGIEEVQGRDVLLLVEGGPDALAGWAVIFQEERWSDAGVVAMASAGPRIHPDALPLFAGKRVRIFEDAGEVGEKAAERWRGQLLQAGAEVDTLNFRGVPDVTDLEEFMRLDEGRRLAELNGTALVPTKGESGENAG